MKIKSLDQKHIFCIYLVTASSIQRFYFSWKECNHNLLLGLLNTISGWEFVYDWQDVDYSFPIGRIHRVTERIVRELEVLRSHFIKDKVYQENKGTISQLYKTISSLEKNELFFIYRVVYTIPKQRLLFKVYTELGYIKKGRTKEEADSWFNTNAALFFEEYSLNFYEKYKQGELSRDKRVCRFCGQSVPHTRFDKDAHAVPEAIGGSKELICYEECDDCNKDFGEGIERDLCNWFDYRRSVFRVRKTSGGVPKAYGQNYVIEDNSISIFGDSSQETQVKALGATTVTLQGIYRALCKIAIDLIEREYLSRLQTTIEWIRFGKPRSGYYPKIAQMDSLPFEKSPLVYIFTRTDRLDKDNSPLHICILRIFDLAFLYVLPHVDGRMLFDDNYTQQIPVEALKLLGFDKEWIWESYDSVEERFPHVWIDLPPKIECQNSHNQQPLIEKLRVETKSSDWIDFPEPQISKSDIKSTEIRNLINRKSIGCDDLKYISGNVSDTKIIVNSTGNDSSFVIMHFAYSDVRTNEYVLAFDASVSFSSSVVRNQIQKEGDAITLHYKLLMFLINYSLDEVCLELLRQYPQLRLNRKNLAVYDAFELYDSVSTFIVNDNKIYKLK